MILTKIKILLLCLVVSEASCTFFAKHNEELSKMQPDTLNIVDSVSSATIPQEQKKVKPPVKKNPYGKLEPYESPYDNLRGWDPAMEDDMEDMGMTRYMENNDDIGWY